MRPLAVANNDLQRQDSAAPAGLRRRRPGPELPGPALVEGKPERCEREHGGREGVEKADENAAGETPSPGRRSNQTTSAAGTHRRAAKRRPGRRGRDGDEDAFRPRRPSLVCLVDELTRRSIDDPAENRATDSLDPARGGVENERDRRGEELIGEISAVSYRDSRTAGRRAGIELDLERRDLPIAGDQIKKALGNDVVAGIARSSALLRTRQPTARRGTPESCGQDNARRNAERRLCPARPARRHRPSVTALQPLNRHRRFRESSTGYARLSRSAGTTTR